MKKTVKILRPYQRKAMKHVSRLRSFALFMEMRLGKTLLSIRIVKSWKPGPADKVLVVAPFSAWNGWEEDLTSEGLQPVFLEGTSAQRIRKLESSNAAWFVTNYESQRGFKKGHGIGKALLSAGFTTLIFDESDLLKNPRSEVSKFYVKRFKHSTGVKHKILLSGTPAPESDMDFVQQLLCIEAENFDFADYYSFRNMHCYLKGFNWAIKTKDKPWFREVLAHNAYMLTLNDVNLGSEIITVKRYVEFDAKHEKIYRTLEEEFILECKEADVFKVTDQSITAMMWQRQLAGGILKGELSWYGKMNELVYLLDGDLKNQQVIVWASFIPELEAVYSVLCAKKISCKKLDGSMATSLRRECTKDFQASKFRVLIANPEVIKYGEDLSTASTAIWYSLPTSKKTFSQATRRTTAVGKTTACFNVLLMTKNSTDQDLLENIEDSKRRNSSMHTLVTRIIKRLTK